MVSEFDGLYAPILGSSEPSDHASTPETVLARTGNLREEYEELRGEVTAELDAMEDRMIRPAGAAKEALAPMKKTIKRRDDKKVPPPFANMILILAMLTSSSTSSAIKAK